MANLNTIQTIKDYFNRHNGLQLANRFSINFYNLPGNIANGNLNEYQAEYIALGPRAINTIQDGLAGFGGGRFVPRSQNLLSGGFGVQVIFPVTNDNHIVNLFNNWFNYLYPGPRSYGNNGGSFSGAFVLPYYDDAIANVTMTVDTLDPNGNINNRLTFYEVFPVETQPIEMSMATVDKYLRYAVTFGYRDYYQNFNL